MEALCHTCKSPLDPTRAPIARVRGLRVVTYCSVACADAGSAAAVVEVTPPVATAEPVVVAVAPAPAEGEVAASVADNAVVKSSAESSSEASAASSATRMDEDEPGTSANLARREVASGSRKWQIVAGSSLALICGMGIVAIEACPSSTDVRAAAERAAVVPRVAEAVKAPQSEAKGADDSVVDDDELFARALASLREFMESPSPRLQRISAMALARNRDVVAIERLGKLMHNNTSDLVGVQIAYTLARAGNQKGLDVLIASLRARKRDARLDAARFLVQLGDQSAVPVLRNMLSYKHFRVGAAGLLARLGDAQGVTALRQVIGSKASSRELRMRALVALGLAGDEAAHEELVAILDGGQYQIGAALALAALGDKRAVSALERQLALDSFRVGAALALRRLGEKVDLTPLAMALQTGNDVSRVTAAEAILILTGPEELAELD